MNTIGTPEIMNIRDLIARLEALEPLVSAGPCDEADREEYARLQALLADVRNTGGDEQWHGAWYPVTFVRDDYFEAYARDLSGLPGVRIGPIESSIAWPYAYIDWTRAAEALRQEYRRVEFNGMTYWYR